MAEDEVEASIAYEARVHTRPIVRIVTLGLIALPIALVLAFWGISEWQASHLSRAHIEKEAALKFPPSATNVHAYSGYVGKDRYLIVRFDMAANDEARFWQSTACAAEESRDYPGDLPADMVGEGARKAAVAGMDNGSSRRHPWWRLGEAQKFQQRQFVGEPIQQILVDKTHPNEYIVYVVCWW